jgi:hypothetical protein
MAEPTTCPGTGVFLAPRKKKWANAAHFPNAAYRIIAGAGKSREENPKKGVDSPQGLR